MSRAWHDHDLDLWPWPPYDPATTRPVLVTLHYYSSLCSSMKEQPTKLPIHHKMPPYMCALWPQYIAEQCIKIMHLTPFDPNGTLCLILWISYRGIQYQNAVINMVTGWIDKVNWIFRFLNHIKCIVWLYGRGEQGTFIPNVPYSYIRHLLSSSPVFPQYMNHYNKLIYNTWPDFHCTSIFHYSSDYQICRTCRTCPAGFIKCPAEALC